jgi:acetylornithine deacetylase
VSEPDSNARTVAAYEAQADRYREQTQGLPKDDWLDRLAADAPPGRILEVGSAHGRDATALERRGRSVHRTDAALAFVEMQRAGGYAADVLDVLTDEIKGPYAAVLANAVLLHFQPDELRRVLAKIRGALLPGGLLAFSVKIGDGSEWSSHKLGVPRFFQYWQPEPLRDLVGECGFDVVALEVDPGTPWDWIRVLARPAGELGDAAVELLGELVAIDSVNPGLADGARGEAAIVEHLRHRVERAGFSTLVVTPDGLPNRPSLLAWHTGSAPGPCLLLNGHVDTVGVDGMAEPFRPRIDGDRLFGRGAADMKGGVAGLVIAAEELGRRARGSVVLALVADEEDRSLGTETVLAHLGVTGLRPDLALVAEPSHLDLTVSLRGFAVVEVEFAGRAAHTSQPDEGVDAVAQLGRFLGAVAAAREPIRARGGELLVSVVRGGSAPFTVADRASATVERRTAPGESSAGALEEVEMLLARMRNEDPTVTATARLVVARESWQLQPAGPARTFATVLDERLTTVPGRTGARFAAPYWMEAPLFEASGIPALVCGPSGGGLHSVDEWVDLRQVRAFPEAIGTAVASLAEGFDAD